MNSTDKTKRVVRISEAKIAEMAVEVARRMLKEGYNQFSDGEGLGMTSYEETPATEDIDLTGKYRYPGKLFGLQGYVTVKVVDNEKECLISIKDEITQIELRSIEGAVARRIIDSVKSNSENNEEARYFLASCLERYYSGHGMRG